MQDTILENQVSLHIHTALLHESGILDVMPVKTGIQLPVVYILLSHPKRSPSSRA